MTEIREFGPQIVGKRHGGDLADERRYFYKCPTCGKPVDMRDHHQVTLHETPGHGRWRQRRPRSLVSGPKQK